MALLLSAFAVQSYFPAATPTPLVMRARRTTSVVAMAGEPLEAWLQDKAGVASKFLPQVMSTCDEEVRPSHQRQGNCAPRTYAQHAIFTKALPVSLALRPCSRPCSRLALDR